VSTCKVSTRGPAERLDQESLDSHTEPVDGPGWPESRSYPVRECLLIILNEAWGSRAPERCAGPSMLGNAGVQTNPERTS